PHNALLLLEHCGENMLRLYLLILVLLGKRDRFLNGFLSANCESIESHFLIPKEYHRLDAETQRIHLKSLRLDPVKLRNAQAVLAGLGSLRLFSLDRLRSGTAGLDLNAARLGFLALRKLKAEYAVFKGCSDVVARNRRRKREGT